MFASTMLRAWYMLLDLKPDKLLKIQYLLLLNIDISMSIGSERPKLKQTNSNSSVTEETKGPKGILKSPAPIKGVISTAGVKPPVPSRNKVNEKLELRSEEVRLYTCTQEITGSCPR